MIPLSFRERLEFVFVGGFFSFLSATASIGGYEKKYIDFYMIFVLPIVQSMYILIYGRW